MKEDKNGAETDVACFGEITVITVPIPKICPGFESR